MGRSPFATTADTAELLARRKAESHARDVGVAGSSLAVIGHTF
jgi:hypothetical protein